MNDDRESKPFDRDAFMRDSERRLLLKGRSDSVKSRLKEQQERFASQGVRYTPHGAFKMSAAERAGIKEEQQVFKITRSPPYETVQMLEVVNKDGSLTATLPMLREWYELFSGGKLEVYVIGIAFPTRLQILSGFTSSDPNNPWGK